MLFIKFGLKKPPVNNIKSKEQFSMSKFVTDQLKKEQKVKN